MPILQCYVDDLTMRRLTLESGMLGRPVEELAESLISEGALEAAKDRARGYSLREVAMQPPLEVGDTLTIQAFGGEPMTIKGRLSLPTEMEMDYK